ncbi:MAG TPA: right-handed parallel beta-helix repeat-containing protein [Gemmataceae bacterium]|nr:right-handed parallel beta-helix repeat-containing protein [Gemmataceae bacterium]
MFFFASRKGSSRLFRASSFKKRSGARFLRNCFKPTLEAFEDRDLPSTFTVVNLADTGRGSLLIGDLRYAVNTANANPDLSNRIVFQPGLAGTIGLTQGPLIVNKNLEIDGPGQDLLTVSGSHKSGVLYITADPRVHVVNVSGLTIADGTGIIVDGDNVGGGIYNDHADLTLSSCTVAGNVVREFGSGGGIYNRSGTLTLNSSTVSGNVAGNGNVGQGGGIYVLFGALTLNSSTVSGNTTGGSTGGNGGGICTSGSLRVGPVTITSSVIADNRTGSVGDGAGLYLVGPATIIDSTISGNTAGRNATGGISLLGDLAGQTIATISRSVIVGNTGVGLSNGSDTLTITSTTVSGNSNDASYPMFAGGIYNSGRLTITDSVISDNVGSGILNSNQLTITGSTISGNFGPSFGGGVEVFEGDVHVVNSTFSGNSAEEGGGGIGVTPFGFLELTGVTMTGNAANGTDPWSGGGGLSVITPYGSGRAVLRNTLVAGNVAAGTAPDVRGGVASLGYNLVGAADDSQGWGPRDLTGESSSPIDPRLGPLQDNGGPTLTHALLADSPAINRGDPALGFSLDQRGTVRFHNGSYPPVDIGAFDANSIHALRLLAPAEVLAGQPFTITVVVLDGSGNTASTYLGRIHFSSTDLGAVLPPDYTFTPADGGMASFTVTLPTAGSQQLQVDTVGAIDYRAAATVKVGPPAAPAAFAAPLFFGDADLVDLGLPSLRPGRKSARESR